MFTHDALAAGSLKPLAPSSVPRPVAWRPGSARIRGRTCRAGLSLAALLLVASPAVPAGAGWQLAQEGMPTYDGLATDGSIWVAAGFAGDIWTSPDAETWTKSVSPDPSHARLLWVTYGGGQFVAVGNGSIVLTSPNGIDWSQQYANPPGWLRSVVYGSGLYVAVGGNGRVITSPDGVDWTVQESATASSLWSVTYGWGPGLFAAVGGGGTVVTSPDGVGWTVQTGVPPEMPDALRGITYTGSQFVVVSQNPAGGPGGVMTSPDGVTWTQRSAPNDFGLRSVAIGNGLIVAVGPGGTVLTSPNGVDWTPREVDDPGPGVSQSLQVVAFGAAGFVAGGVRGNVYLSPDGTTTWVSRTMPTSRSLWGVAHDGVRYCAVGSNGAAASSPDGATWTNETAPDHTIYYSWSRSTHAAGLFWAVGVSDSIMSSPDCAAWTVRYPEIPPEPGAGATSYLTDIAYGEGILVAVGEVYPTPGEVRLRILTSVDAGASWTAVDPPVPSIPLPGYWWIAAAYGNGRFVLSAMDATGDSTALVSADGLAWIEVEPPPFEPLELFQDIEYGDGLFVAAGDRIWTSQDGIQWTPTPGLEVGTQYFNSVARGAGGRWVAVGNSGVVFTSPDAAHWFPEEGATAHHQYAVTGAVGGSRFVSVGDCAIELTDSITPIFADGFESGDASAWSDSLP